MLRRVPAIAFDLAAAGALLVAYAPNLQTARPITVNGEALPPGYPPPGWVHGLAWAVALAIALPVLARRQWPLAVLGVTLVASMAGQLLFAYRLPYLGPALALYTVALALPRVTAVAGLATAVTASTGTGLVASAVGLDLDEPGTASVRLPAADTVAQLAVGVVLLVAAWTIGLAVREQRAYVLRSAEQAARQKLTDERVRIARELHDIVAHSMSVIAVKAGVANHVAEARPQEARAALGQIEATSRGALVELRRVLGVLRSDGGAAGGAAGLAGGPLAGELSPAPGLADLPKLAERTAMAGVQVDLAVAGVAKVPDGVAVSAYRIVQEALTNVVRHAGVTSCRVRVAADEHQVRIEVVDAGTGARPGSTPGHGLVGMRERVAMYGGSFTAGPHPDGGFAVSASLPYERPAR